MLRLTYSFILVFGIIDASYCSIQRLQCQHLKLEQQTVTIKAGTDRNDPEKVIHLKIGGVEEDHEVKQRKLIINFREHSSLVVYHLTEMITSFHRTTQASQEREPTSYLGVFFDENEKQCWFSFFRNDQQPRKPMLLKSISRDESELTLYKNRYRPSWAWWTIGKEDHSWN